MNFPKFPNGFKQHMPFVTIINNQEYYFVCMCQLQSTQWKLYWWHNNQYVRVTDDEVATQCNPVFSEYDGRLILSYIKSVPFRYNTIVCLQLINDKFEFVQKINAPVGCFFKGNYFMPQNNIVIDGIDFSVYGYDYIYAIRFCEKGMLVTLSQKTNSERDTLLIDNDKNIYKLMSDSSSIYKPTMLNNEWFKVITLKGNYDEMRFVVKDSKVRMEKL